MEEVESESGTHYDLLELHMPSVGVTLGSIVLCLIMIGMVCCCLSWCYNISLPCRAMGKACTSCSSCCTPKSDATQDHDGISSESSADLFVSQPRSGNNIYERPETRRTISKRPHAAPEIHVAGTARRTTSNFRRPTGPGARPKVKPTRRAPSAPSVPGPRYDRTIGTLPRPYGVKKLQCPASLASFPATLTTYTVDPTVNTNAHHYNEYVNASTMDPNLLAAPPIIPPNVSPANSLPPLGSGLQLENLQQPEKSRNLK